MAFSCFVVRYTKAVLNHTIQANSRIQAAADELRYQLCPQVHVPTCQIFKYQLCSASENTSAHMSRYSNRRAVFLNQSLCFVKVTLFFNCHYTDRDLSMRILNQVPTARFQFEDQESGLRLDIAIQGVRITDSGLMIINQGRDQCPTRDQWPIS